MTAVGGERPNVGEALGMRLRQLGLHRVAGIRLHRNAVVMVSLTRRGELRLHEGYAEAPDRVLEAIVRFVRPMARRVTRQAALAVIRAWPLAGEGREARGERVLRIPRVRPEDREIVERLGSRWAELNALHFGGSLQPIPILISGRMRRKLGELRYERSSRRATRITLSRRLVRRHTWAEVEETLLHEMVHQWQAETGRPVDHGAEFRRKAREVGVVPRAVAGPKAAMLAPEGLPR